MTPSEPQIDTPRFCPTCAQPRSHTERNLCFRCGDSLLEQGFCPVCDRYWAMAQGLPCPKHELPLEGSPIRPIPEPIQTGKWVTVATFGHPFEAEARRLRLEAEGIPTFLDGARMGSHTLYQMATGGIKLQVPIGLVDDARIVLNQSWAMPVVDELEDAWEELGSPSGAVFGDVALRIAVIPILIGATLLAVLVSLLTSA